VVLRVAECFAPFHVDTKANTVGWGFARNPAQWASVGKPIRFRGSAFCVFCAPTRFDAFVCSRVLMDPLIN
jgi:hypothetical protein